MSPPAPDSEEPADTDTAPPRRACFEAPATKVMDPPSPLVLLPAASPTDPADDVELPDDTNTEPLGPVPLDPPLPSWTAPLEPD